MHGNGNNFVIINSIDTNIFLTKDFIQSIASGADGVSFDQLILVSPPESHEHDFLIEFYNVDGG